MAFALNKSFLSSQLAELLDLELGGPDLNIQSVASIENAASGSLIYLSQNRSSNVSGVICIASDDFVPSIGMAHIISNNPRRDFVRAIGVLQDRGLLVSQSAPPQISDSALVAETAVIENDCRIGDGVIIEHNAVIMRGTVIGDNSRVRANATIGSDGFGFELMNDGCPIRFIHLGGVMIGKDVEIGANTCVAKGTLDNTIIEDFAKIDNLVHIAHNVIIGSGAFVIAGAEISGGCTVGARAWIGPNACVREKLKIGEGSIVGIGSTVVKNIPNFEIWAGNPAKFYRHINGAK